MINDVRDAHWDELSRMHLIAAGCSMGTFSYRMLRALARPVLIGHPKIIAMARLELERRSKLEADP